MVKLCCVRSNLESFFFPIVEIKGCRLSHGARALAKHVDRSSDGFWGVLQGTGK